MKLQKMSISGPDSAPERTVAAPSWVVSGTIRENARFMANCPGAVDEIAICCFESSCANDPELQEAALEFFSLPFSWHVHLPTDLPWHDMDAACAAITSIARGLAPKGQSLRGVLHPPPGPDAASQLSAIGRAWQGAGCARRDLLLENVSGIDLKTLLPVIEQEEFSVCLDTGHALAFGQTDLLNAPRLLERVRLLHLHAPGINPESPAGPLLDKHRPLTELNPAHYAFTAAALAAAPQDAVIEIEVFNWRGYCDSLPVLARLLAEVARSN